MEKNPQFLKQKYNLHDSPEVGKAARRTEEKTGEAVSQKPADRIQNYLDRFNEILERENPEERDRGIDAIKCIMHREYVVDTSVATTEYFKRQKRIAREQGRGDLQVPDSLEERLQRVLKENRLGKNRLQDIVGYVLQSWPNEQRQMAQEMAEEIVALITEQEESLDQWVDYLASPEATYPDWLKYWVIRNVVTLSRYDKKKKFFPKRDATTINPFPDLNREALAYVLDAIHQKKEGKKFNFDQLGEEDRKQLEQLLAGENFAKLYAWAFEKLTLPSVETLAITDGLWVKYPKGSDAARLHQSLQGRGTGWPIAGESVAKSQLSRSDFYVYYSQDEQKKPTIPRVAIRRKEGSIIEVRGISEQQNLDPYIAPIVGEKMKEFHDGEGYEKKAKDMKHLTALEQKIKLGQPLTKDDLFFLYEINSLIEGFGEKRDPRINQLRNRRHVEFDAPKLLGCSGLEIAWRQRDINETTKAYIGPLFPGIFKKFGHLEHIYTSFPEGKIRHDKITIGSKDAEELAAELEQAGIRVSDHAKHIMEQPEFSPQQSSEEVDLISLTVKDLGFFKFKGTTIDEIYVKAAEFGLEPCPAEVGPQYCLAYTTQSKNEHLFVAMKTISGHDGLSDVFSLSCVDSILSLGSRPGMPGWQLYPMDRLVFRLRK